MKDKSVKVRVTEKEKENLMRLAKKEKQTLSAYLLEKGLSEKRGPEGIPLFRKVETIDFLNELWHRVQKCNDRELKADIGALYRERFSGLQEGDK